MDEDVRKVIDGAVPYIIGSPAPEVNMWPGSWPFRDAPGPEEPRQLERVDDAGLEVTDAEDPLSAVSEEEAANARAAARDHPDGAAALEGRHAELGIGRLDAMEPGAGRVILAYYNYDEDVVVEVTLEQGGLEVASVEKLRYRPPLSEAEATRAADLARGDPRIAGELTDDLDAQLLVAEPSPDEPGWHHRLVDVRFGRGDERLPRLYALIDLSAETVIDAGRVGQE